mgnify:CR=1 FL=1
MTANVQKTYVKNWSRDEWLQFRQGGIGGSDIGTLLCMNPYKCAAQLFLEKIGLYPVVEQESLPMFMGKYMEDKVAELWQYWNGYPESIIENYTKGIKLNKCRRVNAYLANPKYPALLASIDREITHRNHEKKRGVLECKTINGMYAQKWEAGIPPYHVAQVQQYLLVTEYDYAEIAMLIDGREMKVLEFEPDEVFQQTIIQTAENFWTKVCKARLVASDLLTEEAKADPDVNKVIDLEEEIRSLEPDADGSEAYETFMKTRYANPEGVREGNSEEVEIVKAFTQEKQSLKLQQSKLQESKNKLIQMIGGYEQISFPGGGKITYRPDSRGRKSLRVSVT